MSMNQEEMPLDQANRGGRAEWNFLLDVADVHVPIGTAVEDSSDQMREISDAERDVRDPVTGELLYDDLEDCAVADRHQRLRQHRRVGSEPATLPAGEDDCPVLRAMRVLGLHLPFLSAFGGKHPQRRVMVFLTRRLRRHAAGGRELCDDLVGTTWVRPRFSSTAIKRRAARLPGRISR